MGILGDIINKSTPRKGTLLGVNVEALFLLPCTKNHHKALKITFRMVQRCSYEHKEVTPSDVPRYGINILADIDSP